MPIDAIEPSPENNTLYRPIDPRAPDIIALAASIKVHGVKEPIVVSEDGMILSGHRRHAAAKLAGLQVIPCRVEPISYRDQREEFLILLREFNRQRDKSLDEKLREEIVSADPDKCYAALTQYRKRVSEVSADCIDIIGTKRRNKISAGKQPMLEAAQAAVEALRKFWPVSDRTIHYRLLRDPPLRHATKPESRYSNTREAYKDLCDLLTRARLTGEVPWQAITDATRPQLTWHVWHDPADFLRHQIDTFLSGYWRDLMRSQPVHIEIVGEKNTLLPILRPIAANYTIPLVLGRGYCSTPPKYEMAQRLTKSGKDRLVLLIVSDFDPDGETIAHSFARSMRDDFGVENLTAVKVALTGAQVEQYKLPPIMKAKTGASTYDTFVERHGDDVYEVEALEPTALQTILTQAIDAIIDIDLFNGEVDRERQDAAKIAEAKQRALIALRGVLVDGGQPT